MNILNDGWTTCKILGCKKPAWWIIEYITKTETKQLHLCKTCYRAIKLAEHIEKVLEENEI